MSKNEGRTRDERGTSDAIFHSFLPPLLYISFKSCLIFSQQTRFGIKWKVKSSTALGSLIIPLKMHRGQVSVKNTARAAADCGYERTHALGASLTLQTLVEESSPPWTPMSARSRCYAFRANRRPSAWRWTYLISFCLYGATHLQFSSGFHFQDVPAEGRKCRKWHLTANSGTNESRSRSQLRVYFMFCHIFHPASSKGVSLCCDCGDVCAWMCLVSVFLCETYTNQCSNLFLDCLDIYPLNLSVSAIQIGCTLIIIPKIVLLVQAYVIGP